MLPVCVVVETNQFNMIHKHSILFFLLLITCSVFSQKNYINIEASIFGIKSDPRTIIINGLTEKIIRTEGKGTGLTFQIANGRNASFGLGMGLNTISFQKETQGVFSETNQFGIAQVDGTISYWCFPISYSLTIPRAYYRSCNRSNKSNHSFKLFYVPCYEGYRSININTLGGAELSSFANTYEMNEQHFQHSLLFSISNQFFLASKQIKISIDPFVGLGSGYFKESATHINTVSYGVNVSLAFHFKLPTISVEKEVDSKNADEKKKQLEQKQKEIKDQLNKQPK